jgi:peptide/nickel transport system permease protein
MKPTFHRALRDPSFTIGALIVVGVVVAAVFAASIAPHDPTAAILRSRLAPPFQADHMLGADAIGRDILSRIVFGARVSLFVGVVSVAIALVIGTFVGLVAGYFRGALDTILMRLADIQLSFPFILLAITVIAVIGPGLWKVVLVMALTQWVQYARVVRGQVLSLREKDFVQAAGGLGASHTRILFRHILLNALTPITVLATLGIANNILLEAGLTFLGLGVDPTVPSWGGMLADGRNYIERAWWVATFPGLAITVTVLGFNLLGDWLRDTLDPRTRR